MKSVFVLICLCIFGCVLFGQVRMVPHITRVGGGFETTVIAENTGEASAAFSLQAYEQNGGMLNAASRTVGSGAIETYSIEALFGSGSTISHFTIESAPDTLRFYVTYRAASGPGSAAHLSETDIQSKRWRVFPGDWSVIFDGIAVVNMGMANTDVQVRQVDYTGNAIETVVIAEDLPPMGKALYVIGAPGNTPFDTRSDASFEVSGSEVLGITALRGTPPGAQVGYLWENTAAPLSGESEPPLEGEYFVSGQAGNDSWEGTLDRPWRTIGHAANVLGPGETVSIMAGTYNERLMPQNSGTAGQMITYRAYQSDQVTLDGTGISLSNEDIAGLVHIFGKSYITISGLRIVNVGPYDNNVGILAENSDHINIEHNTTYNTSSSGIGVWGCSNIIIDGNEVELACNDGEQECISVAVTDTFEIMNNHVHHGGPGTIGGEGICPKDGSTNGSVHHNHVHHLTDRSAIYVDAWDKHTHHIEVYQNVAHDIINNDGIALASEQAGLLQHIRIFNNLVYDNDLTGISLTENGDTPTHPMQDIFIVNNTVVGNGGSEWGGGLELGHGDMENIVIRNNIFSQNVNYQIIDFSNLTGLSIDHNLIDGFRDEQDEEIRGTDFVEGDPLFADRAAFDFHLMSGSPAIDAGAFEEAPSFDFDGAPRPSGAGIDIGAFER